MIQDQLKKAASIEALKYIKPGSIIGVGTGSTIMHFIYALSFIKDTIQGVVSTSLKTTSILEKIGIKVFELNEVKELSIYIDSADEINPKMQMIKGGGAALTQEKIVAANAKKFICILDESKQVKILGKFPLPIEIIPMSLNFVKREIIKKIGGIPKYRKNIVTDNGNIIIDIHNLKICKPISLEKSINLIPGVITVGLFSIRKADVAIIGTTFGIKKVTKDKIRGEGT